MRLLPYSPFLLSVLCAAPALAMGGFSVAKAAEPKTQPAKAAAAKAGNKSFGFCYFHARGRYGTRIFISPLGQGTPVKDAAKREAEAYLLTGGNGETNQMGESGCVQGPTLESVELELGKLSGGQQHRVVEAGNPNVLYWGYCQYRNEAKVLSERKAYMTPVFAVRKSEDFAPWQAKIAAAAGVSPANVWCRSNDFYEASSGPVAYDRRSNLAYGSTIIDVRLDPSVPVGTAVRTTFASMAVPKPTASAAKPTAASGSGKSEALIVRELDQPAPKSAAPAKAVAKPKVTAPAPIPPAAKSTPCGGKGQRNCRARAM